MADKESTLAGWGRHAVEGREVRSENLETLSATEGVSIARGLGRSYGDSSLPNADRPLAINTTLADRILSFDTSSGLMRAEAGLSLSELNRVFIPRGWFVPVSPGTKFVTLGGMVAADVHGKNQHVAGNIGDHVTELSMRVASDEIVTCSQIENKRLFEGTVGGIGLTGHILEVEFHMKRIPSPWIYQETTRIDDIDAFQHALEEAATKWPYTVGWIDCVSGGKNMGRGILMCGRWAEKDEAPRKDPFTLPRMKLPFDFPGWALGPLSVRAFNELYFRRHVPRVKRGFVSPETFYYPLDFMLEWNRMYGRRGFTQYQCVLPRSAGHGSSRRLLTELSKHGAASFLCVIKDFGRQSFGTLSFPKPGVTIALDIPIRAHTPELVSKLNELVLNEGGRIYLAKDSFTTAEHYRAMDGERVARFTDIRDEWDPERRFSSAQSMRLFGS